MLRWEVDYDLLRSFPDSLLVYVTASPQTRFQRLKLRREKAGEENLTRPQFLAEEKIKTELLIPKIG